MSLRAELTTSQKPLVPGGETEAELLICNEGQADAVYTLSLVGDIAEQAGRDRGRIAVRAGERRKVGIPLALPPGSRMAPGPTVFAVMVQSVDNPRVVSVPEAVVQVGVRHEIDARFTRAKVRGRLSGSTLLWVRNLGNAKSCIRISDDSGSGTATVGIGHAELDLRPGCQGRVEVQAKGKKLLLTGKPITYRVPVRVEVEGTTAAVVEFAYDQVPLLSRRLARSTVGLAALVAAGALLWSLPGSAEATYHARLTQQSSTLKLKCVAEDHNQKP
ncbi:COG1470 family protein [Streptomyces sp. NPDC002537]